MSTELLIQIFTGIYLVSFLVLFVGLVAPTLYIKNPYTEHKRWLIFGLWLAFVFFLMVYAWVTMGIMRIAPSFVVWCHLLLSISIPIWLLTSNRVPFPKLDPQKKQLFGSLAIFSLDLILIGFGWLLTKTGINTAEGSGNTLWVNERIDDLKKDAQTLDSIETLSLNDTITIHGFKSLLSKVDSLGRPHLHGTFVLDSSFFYTDERIASFSIENQKHANKVREIIQQQFKLYYLHQLRELYADYSIYLYDNGEAIVIFDKSMSSSYKQHNILDNISDDLKIAGFKTLYFKWGEDEIKKEQL